MKNFTLNKLWDLRAELDKAIADKEYDKIKVVKVKYQNLVEGEKWFSRAFICYNHAFWSDGERQNHNVLNVNSILINIENFERKYIDGEDVSVKLKTPLKTPFLAQEIWILRAMYDKFILQGKSAGDVDKNMILGKAVQDRLVTLMSMEQTEDFVDQIRPILQEVSQGYENVYGKKQPKIDYIRLSEDFWEK